MEQTWRDILTHYGCCVTVYPQTGEEGLQLKAFLQPVREKGTEQVVPSPLGMKRTDRFLYLGPGHTPLTPRVSQVLWNGQLFEVQAAQPVGGKKVHHWWAVLRPRDKEDL